MKRVLILLAAIMLFSAPAMAANTITYKGPQGQGASQGQMQNVVNQTNLIGSKAINNGTNNTMDVGTIDNKGQMKNVVNQTNVRDSQLINNGTGNAMRVGGITNQ